MNEYRRTLVACLVSVSALVAFAVPVRADAPAYIPLQGYLTDAEGKVLDGDQAMTFALYGSDDLGSQCLHQEDQTVTVDEGYFTVYLGDGKLSGDCEDDASPINLSIFRDRSIVFLGVRVGSDPEASPRIQLATTPFAALAQYAVDAAKLGGVDAASFARTTDVLTQAQVTGFAKDACFDTTSELMDALDASYVSSVVPGGGLSSSGSASAVVLTHADTSGQGNVNNSGTTVIQDLSFDTYGHVTQAVSTTLTTLDSLTGCTTGDVPVWNGTSWVCGEQRARTFTTNPELDLFATVPKDVQSGGTQQVAIYLESDTITSDPTCSSSRSGLTRIYNNGNAEQFFCFCNKVNLTGAYRWWCIEIEP